jgi:hypothetical protein
VESSGVTSILIRTIERRLKMEDIELKVGGEIWIIRGAGMGTYKIMVNEKIVAYYHDGYPEPFVAAWRRALREVRDELGVLELPC